MAAPERVTVVAAGVVTPIGADLEAFWSALVTGASGISQIERVAVADLRVQRGGEVKKVGRIKDWRGQDAGDARSALSHLGFKVKGTERYSASVPKGSVIRQYPHHGIGHREIGRASCRERVFGRV